MHLVIFGARTRLRHILNSSKFSFDKVSQNVVLRNSPKLSQNVVLRKFFDYTNDFFPLLFF